jgi:hypothetical protein
VFALFPVPVARGPVAVAGRGAPKGLCRKAAQLQTRAYAGRQGRTSLSAAVSFIRGIAGAARTGTRAGVPPSGITCLSPLRFGPGSGGVAPLPRVVRGTFGQSEHHADALAIAKHGERHRIVHPLAADHAAQVAQITHDSAVCVDHDIALP